MYFLHTASTAGKNPHRVVAKSLKNLEKERVWKERTQKGRQGYRGGFFGQRKDQGRTLPFLTSCRLVSSHSS